ncbi:MAG TPA: ankyrin repeat domain-containing protein [Armatimonadaceae bacterium]|nr:ankyrin repeat domain-containing protein [Armatimonadaceae bacterium]
MICRELTDACREGDRVCARILVERGADVNFADPERDDWYSWTPLMHASARGHEDLIALLLAGGADVHFRDRDANTALTLACREGHWSIAALLLDRGADPSERDHCDESAIDYALRDGQQDLVDRMRLLCRKMPPVVDAGVAA